MQLLRIEVLLMTALCRNKNFILFGSEVYMEKRYTESIGPITNPGIQPIFGQCSGVPPYFDKKYVIMIDYFLILMKSDETLYCH